MTEIGVKDFETVRSRRLQMQLKCVLTLSTCRQTYCATVPVNRPGPHGRNPDFPNVPVHYPLLRQIPIIQYARVKVSIEMLLCRQSELPGLVPWLPETPGMADMSGNNPLMFLNRTVASPGGCRTQAGPPPLAPCPIVLVPNTIAHS
jgi:hypothetical protein